MPQLKTYTVQAPDGRTITLQGPAGAPQDEVIRQAQALYSATPKPAPAKGVDDPTREMSAGKLGDALSAEYLASLLGPFSMRGPENAQGKASFKAPDILTSLGKTMTSNFWDQLQQLMHIPSAIKDRASSVVSIAKDAASGLSVLAGGTGFGPTGNPLDQAGMGGQLTLEIPAAVEGGKALAGDIAAATLPLGKMVAEKELAAKLWNRVAKVKTGREGVQLDLKSGEFKTLPGRSMVDDTTGSLSEAARAFFAKPSPKTQAQAYGELAKRGQELGAQLGKSTTPMELASDIPLGINKVQEALNAAGVAVKPKTITGPNIGGGIGAPPSTIPSIEVNPTQAHAVRSAIGDRINWNPAVLNEANEAMKDAYFSIGRKLDTVLPSSVKPYLKDWQESYLFNKALKSTMEQAATKPVLLPKWAKTGAKIVVGEEVVRRMLK